MIWTVTFTRFIYHMSFKREIKIGGNLCISVTRSRPSDLYIKTKRLQSAQWQGLTALNNQLLWGPTDISISRIYKLKTLKWKKSGFVCLSLKHSSVSFYKQFWCEHKAASLCQRMWSQDGLMWNSWSSAGTRSTSSSTDEDGDECRCSSRNVLQDANVDFTSWRYR